MLLLLDETWYMQYINVYLYVSCGVRANICVKKIFFGKNRNFIWSRDQARNCRLLQDDTKLNIKIFIFLLETAYCICFSRLLRYKCFSSGSCNSMLRIFLKWRNVRIMFW